MVASPGPLHLLRQPLKSIHGKAIAWRHLLEWNRSRHRPQSIDDDMHLLSGPPGDRSGFNFERGVSYPRSDEELGVETTQAHHIEPSTRVRPDAWNRPDSDLDPVAIK